MPYPSTNRLPLQTEQCGENHPPETSKITATSHGEKTLLPIRNLTKSWKTISTAFTWTER